MGRGWWCSPSTCTHLLILLSLIYPLPFLHPCIHILWYPHRWAGQLLVVLTMDVWRMSSMTKQGNFAVSIASRTCGSADSAWSGQAHSTFHRHPKITQIFWSTLHMDSDSSVFWLWAINASASRYEASSFQSCQNFLLYQRLHFLLMLTTNQLSHGK